LAVIDTRSNKVDRWIKLPAAGYGSASTPDGKYLLIAVPAADGVAVIDLATFQVLKTITVPHSPQEVVIRPDGQIAYVSCSAAGKVAAIKITAIKIVDWSTKTIEAGPGADGLAWAK
jgi:YVTN family beta-propeller protein